MHPSPGNVNTASAPFKMIYAWLPSTIPCALLGRTVHMMVPPQRNEEVLFSTPFSEMESYYIDC